MPKQNWNENLLGKTVFDNITQQNVTVLEIDIDDNGKDLYFRLDVSDEQLRPKEGYSDGWRHIGEISPAKEGQNS